MAKCRKPTKAGPPCNRDVTPGRACGAEHRPSLSATTDAMAHAAGKDAWFTDGLVSDPMGGSTPAAGPDTPSMPDATDAMVHGASAPFPGADVVGLPTPELRRDGERIRIDYHDHAVAFIDLDPTYGTLGVKTNSTLGPNECVDLASRIDIAAGEAYARYGETHGADSPADLMDNTIADRPVATDGDITRVEFGDTSTAEIVVERRYGTVGLRINAALAPNEAQMFARILAARAGSLSASKGRPVQPARSR